jgi:D-alanyl-D-alanine carboxypeptidase
MPRKISRSLYRGLLRLHPPAFRERFGEEMLWIFDEAAEMQGVARLLADGVVSLVRQWMVRPESRKWTMAVAAPPGSGDSSAAILTWGQFETPGHVLPFYRWVQGCVISLSLLSAVWLMAGHGGRGPTVRAFAVPSENTDSLGIPGRADTQASAAAAIADETELVNRDENGYRATGTPENFREHQLRQQERALQAAIGGQWVPGSVAYFAAAQGVAAAVPKTPAGEQFSAWLGAFNSGERARLEAFLRQYKNPGDQDVNGALGFRQQTGGFDLRKIEESTSTRIAGLVQERDSDQFARFAIEVEAEAPHRITRLDLQAIPRPAEFPVERMSQSELLTALKTRLEKDSAADKFAGSVVLAKDGKTIFAAAYGMADREKKVLNTLDTKFRIGSMNKMFTATSILQLVQAGKISLSDPFGKYVTDYPNKDVASKVTIQELLTHTGGTGDIFGPQFEQHRKELRTLQDYVNLYGQRSLDFEPGSRWVYSNYGFLLLGVVVERVSGKSYYDYVRENVYAPAGMTSSGSLAEDQVVPGRSVGYTRFGGNAIHPNTDTLPYRGTSAGGGYATAEDLLRFASAVTSDKLLNAQNRELLTTGKVDTPRGEKYAFGFMDAGRDGEMRHYGHGGGAPGMNGDLQIYPQDGYVIVVLSNLDPPAASRISDFIANRLPRK